MLSSLPIGCPVVPSQESADQFPSAYDANDPFFAFSVADVTPDFGDDSRYRRRAVRKLARILASRNLAARQPN